MKWFALCGAIAVATVAGELSTQAGSASPIKGMSYPSASFGRILPARLLNAIRIGGSPHPAAEQVETVSSQPPTRRVVHIIGSAFE